MSKSEGEDDLLRSVAMRNATTILHARQRAEEALRRQSEWLRVTLSSIGDAVIATDAAGRVTFLNRVAESLTGWRTTEAEGRPLVEVFKIVNEKTREPVDNPALRALKEGKVVGLANHTILISRDGSERAIDDSASPMLDDAGAVIGAVLVFRDVTDRNLAAERLRESEVQAREAAAANAKFKTLFEQGAQFAGILSVDGVVMEANRLCLDFCGFTREEVVGKPFWECGWWNRLPQLTETIRKACDLATKGVLFRSETPYYCADGSERMVDLVIAPVTDEAGRILFLSPTGTDVTDRKRAEEAVLENEVRRRFLAELAAVKHSLEQPEQIMAATARMLAEHLQVDRCAYAEVEEERQYVITGDYTRGVASIVGRWPIAAFGESHLQSMLAGEPWVIDDLESDPRLGEDLTAYRQTDIEAVVCVPLHKGGKFVAAMAVHQKTPRKWKPDEIELVRTVTERSWESLERARVARDQRGTADQLALALAAASLGDWGWDAATDAVRLSPRALAIFGLQHGEGVTWNGLQRLMPPEDAESARVAVMESLESRGQYDVEYRVQLGNGEVRWISAKGRGHYDASGRAVGMYGVVQDVTDRKRLEQELRERAEELMEADQKKDDFIALLAHELRNPLAPVRNGLQVMKLAAPDADAVKQVRSMMDRQLGHMVRIIDDLLDVSRIGRNKMELRLARIPLSEVVKNALEATTAAFERGGVQLDVTLPGEPIPLDADLTRLSQVLSNLLSNSAKYTKRGGRARLVAERLGTMVRISVEDTGIGIPKESLPTIFDMFSQVDRSIERTTGGLGIGLALVKGLTEMHGGSVSAASDGVNKGSVFTIDLPIADEPKSTMEGPTTARVAESSRRRRILVADDNRDSADSMALMLELMGNEVVTAKDGLDAVEKALEFRPNVVLMDVGMPRMNGLDATRRLREQPWGNDLTIIAVTGWGQEGDRERTRDAGCNGHLVKPISLEDLKKLLGGDER